MPFTRDDVRLEAADPHRVECSWTKERKQKRLNTLLGLLAQVREEDVAAGRSRSEFALHIAAYIRDERRWKSTNGPFVARVTRAFEWANGGRLPSGTEIQEHLDHIFVDCLPFGEAVEAAWLSARQQAMEARKVAHEARWAAIRERNAEKAALVALQERNAGGRQYLASYKLADGLKHERLIEAAQAKFSPSGEKVRAVRAVYLRIDRLAPANAERRSALASQAAKEAWDEWQASK